MKRHGFGYEKNVDYYACGGVSFVTVDTNTGPIPCSGGLGGDFWRDGVLVWWEGGREIPVVRGEEPTQRFQR